MLKQQLQSLQQFIKKNKRSIYFQNAFANVIINTHKSSIRQNFNKNFPHISIFKSELQFQKRHSLSYLDDNTMKTVETQQNFSEGKEQELYRKFKHNQFMKPEKEEEEEIQRIINAFNSCRSNGEKFFDELYDFYVDFGGEKTAEELRCKLELDLMYLVKRENQKQHQRNL